MGFWHTGYLEFHEPTGLDSDSYISVPKEYSCKQCDAVFDSEDELYDHLFEAHPFARPVLFVRGTEVGTTPLRITRPLKKGDICVHRCDDAWFNGVKLSLSDLCDKLAGETNNSVTVKLANKDLNAEFSLDFEIPAEEDLAGVNRHFLDMAHRGRLDMRALEDFIRASEEYPSAEGYLNGICEYLYGVLAKERAADSSLSYEAYREKFTIAEDSLKGFDAPLALVICSLIAFHFNRFSESMALAAGTRVGMAARRFKHWLGDGAFTGDDDLLPHNLDARIEKLLTDFESERVLDWCVATPKKLLACVQDIESLISKDIPEYDKTKLHLLMAELYAEHGDGEKAKRHARELRNNQIFGLWAERLLDRLK